MVRMDHRGRWQSPGKRSRASRFVNFSNIGLRIQGRYLRIMSFFFSRRLVQLEHRFPVISFTFDDFPQSALNVGGKILERFRLAGTYYASLGLMNRESP